MSNFKAAEELANAGDEGMTTPNNQSLEIEQRLSHLEAENRELRRLWIETEGDVLELRTYLDKCIADLDDRKQDVTQKALAGMIMRIHRLNGGVIREKRSKS